MLFKSKFQYVLIISICLLVSAIHPNIKLFICIIFILYSIKSIEYFIMAFSFISFIGILNPVVYGYSDSYFILLKNAFTLSSFFYILFLYRKSTKSRNILFKYLSYFILYLFLVNIFNPTYLNKSISILKLISFYSTTSVIVLAFSIANDTKKITSWMMSLGLVGLSHSIFILIFFKNSGTMFGAVGGDKELFRGAFLHANSIGITLVPFLILYLYNLLMHKGIRYEKYYYSSIAAATVMLIYLSKARGSIVGFLIAILISIIIALFSKNMKKEIKFIIKDNFYTSLFLIITILIFISTLKEFSSELILKGTDLDSSDLSGVFMASRGAFMLISFQNFLSNPFFGIGFGVPSVIEYARIVYDPIFNLPISAPVEKAFFFSALLEEFGIIGTLIFLNFYFKMSKFFYKKINSLFFLILYFSIFTLSIFEYYFFSMGTLGSFNWLWIGFMSHIASKDNYFKLKNGY
jgi:hypothetical protein